MSSHVSHNGDVSGLQLEHLINFRIKKPEEQLPSNEVNYNSFLFEQF